MALEHFARQVGAGERKRLLLVLDRAGWHPAAQKLKVPEGIHLEFLHSHSPVLQPSERLWPLANEGVANRATSGRSRRWRRRAWSVARLCASSPRSYAPTSATTGGRRGHENRDYSNGLIMSGKLVGRSASRLLAKHPATRAARGKCSEIRRTDDWRPHSRELPQIGRASCRERV